MSKQSVVKVLDFIDKSRDNISHYIHYLHQVILRLDVDYLH